MVEFISLPSLPFYINDEKIWHSLFFRETVSPSFCMERKRSPTLPNKGGLRSKILISRVNLVLLANEPYNRITE